MITVQLFKMWKWVCVFSSQSNYWLLHNLKKNRLPMGQGEVLKSRVSRSKYAWKLVNQHAIQHSHISIGCLFIFNQTNEWLSLLFKWTGYSGNVTTNLTPGICEPHILNTIHTQPQNDGGTQLKGCRDSLPWNLKVFIKRHSFVFASLWYFLFRINWLSLSLHASSLYF